MKSIAVAIVCLAWLAGAVLAAHDDYRIIGTLEKITAANIEVKQAKDGKIITMEWQKASKVTRDKKAVPRAELTPGLHVVVNARGDSLLELDIVEVRIVPPPAKK